MSLTLPEYQVFLRHINLQAVLYKFALRVLTLIIDCTSLKCIDGDLFGPAGFVSMWSVILMQNSSAAKVSACTVLVSHRRYESPDASRVTDVTRYYPIGVWLLHHVACRGNYLYAGCPAGSLTSFRLNMSGAHVRALRMFCICWPVIWDSRLPFFGLSVSS